MRTSFALAVAAVAFGFSVSAANAQNNLPPIPAVNCPPGTAPSITQIGGGGVNFGKVGVNLPSYTKVECPPVQTPTPKPSPSPSPSPKK